MAWLWALIGLVAVRGPASAEPFFGVTAPRFAADVTTHLDASGSPSVHVEIQVAYPDLQFVRVGAGYGADVEFVVVIRAGSREAAGDVWEERFVVGTFEETRNTLIRVASDRTFHVPQGRYRVKVQVRDLNSSQSSEAEHPIEVVGLGKSTLGLADLVFGSCGSDSAGGSETFQPSASRRYGENVSRFCVQSAVLDLADGDRSERRYRVLWRVRDEAAIQLTQAETTIVGEAAKRFFLHPPVSSLFLGTYELQIEVQEGKRSWEQNGSFEIEAMTAPVGPQWATLIEILEFVSTPTDLDPLRKATTPEERTLRWKQFWLRRDPTPGTERNEALLEFMRRVRYANSQFQGLGQGWRSDQGHIYIQYGAPDQIEENPASSTSYPTQIWHYYALNRRYVFIDRDGFGRYALVSESGP